MRATFVLCVALLASMPLSACMPQELVLRKSSVDWDSLGMRVVAVVPVAPPPRARMLTSFPASGSTDTAAPAAAESITAPSAPPSAATEAPGGGYGEGDLGLATRDAAELLTFALRQSAVEIVESRPGLPRLELTVKEITAEEEVRDEKDLGVALRQSTILSLRDDVGYLRATRVVRATVSARLLDPGATRPVWFKEAIGSVDIGMSRSAAASAGDPFPPPSRTDGAAEEDVLRFYREVAVRRALKQIADDLLPHYEYVELK